MFDSVQDAGRDDAIVSMYRVFINDQRRDFEAQEGEIQRILIGKLMLSAMYSVTVIVINNLGEEGNNCTSVLITTLEEGKSAGIYSLV